jgi:hypothetical protein
MLTKFIVMALAAAVASAREAAPGSVDQDGSGALYSFSSFPGTTVPPTSHIHFSPHSTISAHATPAAVPACAPYPIGMNVDGLDNEEFVIVRRDALKRDGSLVALEPTVVTGADGVNTTLYNTLPYGSPPTVTNTQTIYISSASPTISAASVTSNTEYPATATPGESSSETAGASASQTFVTASHSEPSTTDTATSINTVTSSIPGTPTGTTETTVTGSDTQTVVTSDTTSPATSSVETTTAAIPTTSTDTTVSVTEITSIPTGDTTTPSTLVTATGTPTSETTTPLTSPSTGHPSSSTGHISTSSTVAPSSTPSSNAVRAAKAGGAMLFGLGGVVALVG